MEVHIRKAKEKDHTKIVILISKYFEKINAKKFDDSKDHFSLIAVKDEEIIGHVRVDKLTDPFKNISYYLLNYICVEEKYRNQHIGSLLLKEEEKKAQEDNIAYLELTSRKERNIAHHLYLKEDFVIRETMVFRKKLR